MSILSPAISRLTDQIHDSVDRLRLIEERMYDRLIPVSEYHPGTELVVTGLPKRLRDLLLLQMIEGLPFNIELSITNKVNQQMKSKTKEELQHFLSLRQRLLGDNMSEREILGRTLPRILTLLSKIGVNLKLPKKPKHSQRPRGYKDHGSMQSPASRNLNQISRDEREKKNRESYKIRLEQLVFEYSTNYESMVEDDGKYRPIFEEIAADIQSQIREHLQRDPSLEGETHSISPAFETTLNRILKGTYPFGAPKEEEEESVVATFLGSHHFVD